MFLDSHLNPDKYPEGKYYEEQRRHGLQIVSNRDKGIAILLLIPYKYRGNHQLLHWQKGRL